LPFDFHLTVAFTADHLKRANQFAEGQTNADRKPHLARQGDVAGYWRPTSSRRSWVAAGLQMHDLMKRFPVGWQEQGDVLLLIGEKTGERLRTAACDRSGPLQSLDL
jgi:hypothetical protein